MGITDAFRSKSSDYPPKRWYSDSALALFTGLMSLITFLISAAACYSGNLRKLAPYDLNADFCGSRAVGVERQYLYYPDPYNPTNGICVESCPTEEWTGRINIPDGHGGITVHPIAASQLVSGQYCFQHRIKSRDILSAMHQQRPFLYSIVQDVFKSTEILFATIFISILLAITGLTALRSKNTGRNVTVVAAIAPCFFMVATVLLTLYHLFTPRVLPPGISLLLVAGVLASLSFCTAVIPVVFIHTYSRAKDFMLVGSQALSEMPDLMTYVIATAAGIGVTVIWNIWICASILTIGRPVPEPLVVESHGETYMGLLTSFTRTPGQGLACLVVAITFALQFESAIAFTRFITTRCVKKWFERLPLKGVRPQRCDYLIAACCDSSTDCAPLGAATFFSPLCRVPSTFMQMLAAENALAPHTDTVATYLQRRLSYMQDSMFFNNRALYVKLDEGNQNFLEAALAGYIEMLHGKVDDHSAGRRYSVQELLSPAFNVGFFSAIALLVTILTWIFLEITPIFNASGEKELDSIPVVVIIALGVSSMVLTIFAEAVDAASCAAVLLWAKSASDVMWCSSINSDTLHLYEAKHLKKYLDQLRKKGERGVLL